MLPGNFTSQIATTVANITYVGAGTKNGVEYPAAGSTINFPYPSGLQTNDLLILICHEDDSGNHATWPPSGWTSLYSGSTTYSGFWLRLAYKFYSSGTGVDVAIPTSGLDHIFGTVAAFRGVDTGSPFGAATLIHTLDKTTPSPNVFDFSNVTTTVDKAFVCNLIGHDIDTSTASVVRDVNASLDPSNRGEQFDISTQLGWNGGFSLYTGTKLTAGLVDNCTGYVKASSYKRFVGFALKPL